MDVERRDEGVASVRRAVALLSFVSERGSVSVTQASEVLGVHKSTASRLIATLVESAFLERDPATKRLQLGSAALRLSGSAVSFQGLGQLARPVLERLASQTHATVNLVVRSGERAVQIDQIDDPRAMATINWVGRDTPLHATSDGKVLLAFATDDVTERVLAGKLMRYTANTITDPRRLRTELAEVRSSGVGRSLGELEEGLNGVSAAIRRSDESVIGCVCVSGPSFVVNPKTLPRFEAACLAAAEAVSRLLGAAQTPMASAV